MFRKTSHMFKTRSERALSEAKHLNNKRHHSTLSNFISRNLSKPESKANNYFFRPLSFHFGDQIDCNSLSMVKLKNGSEATEKSVHTAMLNLRCLYKESPMAFYELVNKAKNPEHSMLYNTQELASKWGLINFHGIFFPVVKDIILSAVKGGSLNLTFDNILLENQKMENANSNNLLKK